MFDSAIAIIVTFCYLSALTMLSTAIYHFYTIHQRKKYATSTKLSFPFIITGIFLHLSILITFTPSIASYPLCNFITYAVPQSYMIFKLFIYLILTSRAKEYFSNSCFAYTPWKLNLWQIIAIIWCITNAISFIPYSTTSLSSTTIPICQASVDPPSYISLSWILLDIIGGAGVSLLLIRPLLRMHKLEQESAKIEEQSKLKDFTSEFKRIAKKQAILSGVSILTSWAAIVALVGDELHNGVDTKLPFVSLDVTVSTLMIILIYSWNEWIFNKLSFCCCCIVKSDTLTLTLKHVSSNTKDVSNLEVVVKESEERESVEITSTTEIVHTPQNTAIIH